MRTNIVTSSLSSRSVRSACLAALLAVFWSCDRTSSTTQSPSEESRTYTTPTIALLDAHKLPDSVNWHLGEVTGRAAWAGSDLGYAISVPFAKPPVGAIGFDLHRAGIRYAQMQCHSVDGATNLTMDSWVVNGLAVEILRRIMPSATAAAFDSALAAALVAGDRMFDSLPYPAKAPAGLDTAAVTALVFQDLAASKKSLAELAKTWSLPWDTLLVKEQVRILFAAGTIKDTSVLLASPPVDHEGPTISITMPASDTTLPTDRDSIEVKASVFDASGVDSVWIDGRPAVKRDSLWSAGNVFVPVSMSGTEILVRAKDAKGNGTAASRNVKREAPPAPGAPRTRILSPTAGAALPFDSASVVVRWKVVDPRGTVTKAWIGGVAAALEDDSVWTLRVALLPDGTASIVPLLAVNAKGDSILEQVSLARAKDAIAPTVEPDGAIEDTVDFDTLSALVSWKVSDNHKLISVRIADSLVAGVKGLYSLRVSMIEGLNPIRIVATDSTGNRTCDSLVLVRSKDMLAPKVVRLAGTADLSVPYLTDSVTAAWLVSDNGSLQSVSIGGKSIARTDSAYRSTQRLVIGRNVIRIQATDLAGNSTRDSVVVVRSNHDSIAPVVTRKDALTGTRTVLYSIKTATVSWQATDASPLSVVINDSVVPAVAGYYTRTLALAVGTNKIRIRATDTAKNATWDSIQITRTQLDSFAAIWRIDSTRQPILVDQSGHGLDLNLSETGKWTRTFDPTLISPAPSGKILYTAKVYMTAYPDSSIYNKAAVVLGFYEGLKMAISTTGQLFVAGQKDNAGAYAWYGPRTINGAVPLNRWTTLAVGADQATGEFYAWIDGVPMQLYSGKAVAGSKVRIASSTFSLGADASDGQKFTGKIAEVKVIDKFIYGAGLAVKLESCIENNCTRTLTPNAYWRPDSVKQASLADKSGHELPLTLVSTGIWSRAFDVSLVAPQPAGRILYTAQVKLSAYPANTYNKIAVVVGFYEGMKMCISSTGQLMIVGQRGIPNANAWYGPRSVASAVPLNRWVTLAVGTDQATGEFYAWIDGIPLRLYSASTIAGTKIRVASTKFELGADLQDGQKFEGQLGEVKVWDNFIYGPGLSVGLDPTIAD